MENIELINNWIWLSIGVLLSFLSFIFFLYFILWFIYQKNKQYKQNRNFDKEYQKLDFGTDKKTFNKLKKHVAPEKLIINLGLFKMDFKVNVHSSNVVWAVLVELSTRIIFNKLDDNDGVEVGVLDSIYGCFCSIREELKKEKLDASILHLMLSLLNKQMRPFLAKWHGKLNEKTSKDMKALFRKELFQFKEQMLSCQETKLIFLILGIKIETLKKVLKT